MLAFETKEEAILDCIDQDGLEVGDVVEVAQLLNPSFTLSRRMLEDLIWRSTEDEGNVSVGETSPDDLSEPDAISSLTLEIVRGKVETVLKEQNLWPAPGSYKIGPIEKITVTAELYEQATGSKWEDPEPAEVKIEEEDSTETFPSRVLALLERNPEFKKHVEKLVEEMDTV